VTTSQTSIREIAALVPMPRLLAVLGFAVHAKSRRAPCILHSGSNPTAFSWREDGLWHCFSCNAGGDRITLVRAVKQLSFVQSMRFLAALAEVEYHPENLTFGEVERMRQRRARAERAAWHVRDEIASLLRYYTNGLHRADRLQASIGRELLQAQTEGERLVLWERLARLCPVISFFYAAWDFLWKAKRNALIRFAIASPILRRRLIFEGIPTHDDKFS